MINAENWTTAEGSFIRAKFSQLITEILWNGQNVSTCSEYRSNSSSTTYEDVDHDVNNNRELVYSRHSSAPNKLKESWKRLTSRNSKTFVISNRFSILADVSESNRLDRSDELLISTEGQDTFSVIGKHLNGANKPKTTPVKQTWDGHN